MQQDESKTEGAQPRVPSNLGPDPFAVQASVRLTADEATELASVALKKFVEAEFEERYLHTDAVKLKQESWDTAAKLIRAGCLTEKAVRQKLEYHRGHFQACADVRDLEDAPVHRRATMTKTQEACTGRAPGRSLTVYVEREARRRLEDAVRTLSARDGGEGLDLTEFVSAYIPEWMCGNLPDLTFPTTDEVVAELMMKLGRDPSWNAYVATFCD